MNQTILTLLSSSCVFYLFVLISHTAIAEGKPSVATITSAPAHQVAGTVASPTKSSATQTTKTLAVQVNPRVFSLDANGDPVGDVAIAFINNQPQRIDCQKPFANRLLEL
ncbi:MAG: hypothetical protein V7K38_29245 [Nostoc sp.]|uniref:hypothetical protein n=1 Tax=Nostoc sp. TaxID=1180 RepID=UPI002FFA4D54